MSHDVDVLVVGAGTAGAAVARACARRGLSVKAIDSRPLDEAGARWVNGVPAWAFAAADVPAPQGAELVGHGSVFHMVAGFGPGRVTLPSDGLLEVDMTRLTARLQADANSAGARLRGEEKARVWESDAHGAVIRTSHGTFSARYVVDASGLSGVPFAPPPAVDRTDLCVAAQEVRDVVDMDAARQYFVDQGVQPGETVCFTGIAGGYSIVNVRLVEEIGAMTILTGSIPGDGHASGPQLLADFVARYPWIGARRMGGSRAIPLVAPLARLVDGPLIRVGDAARQVFAAHGSGIGAQLVAAHTLADTLASGGTPHDWAVSWHRTWGGLFCGSLAFARFSRQLDPDSLRELFESGLMAPGVAGQMLLQRHFSFDPRALRDVPGFLMGAVLQRGWVGRFAPLVSRMARLELLHKRYPLDPAAVDSWARERDALLSQG